MSKFYGSNAWTNHIIENINKLYLKRGGNNYTIDEPVSILKHSLQTAKYCQVNHHGCSSDIVACLLHDYGHLLGTPVKPSSGINDFHEISGAFALEKLGFPEDITRPISLHVKAKRYLHTVDSEYKLSTGSTLSLNLQGGKMTDKELREFEHNPYFNKAILLRICDDHGKHVEPSMVCDSILEWSYYISYILNRGRPFIGRHFSFPEISENLLGPPSISAHTVSNAKGKKSQH